MLEPASSPSSSGPAANRPRERRRAGKREAASRKHRIFERLAEGGSHAAIAQEENCSIQWIRRIIAETLQGREADPFEEFRKLQVARLSLALNVGYKALMEGKLAAVDPYLKTIKALDRYHGGKNVEAHGGDANASAATGAARRRAPKSRCETNTPCKSLETLVSKDERARNCSAHAS
jgi:Mor family transcriptional regulator